MKRHLIEKWELIGGIISFIIIAISFILEIFFNCFTSKFPISLTIITGLACGFIATVIVLFLGRNHIMQSLAKYYSTIDGCYERIDIGQDNTDEKNLVNIRSENIGLKIRLKYLGGHEFSIDIDYWKSENAKAIGIIEFNSKNKTSAIGNYRYIQGKRFKGLFGKLEITRDENKNDIIVFYQHQYPRELPYNPDKNRGWEVWRKININNCS